MTKRKIDQIDESHKTDIITNKRIKFDINQLILNELKKISKTMDEIIQILNNSILDIEKGY